MTAERPLHASDTLDRTVVCLIVALEKLTDRIERLERATAKPRLPYDMWLVQQYRDYGRAA
jgi:hypothetical protein